MRVIGVGSTTSIFFGDRFTQWWLSLPMILMIGIRVIEDCWGYVGLGT